MKVTIAGDVREPIMRPIYVIMNFIFAMFAILLELRLIAGILIGITIYHILDLWNYYDNANYQSIYYYKNKDYDVRFIRPIKTKQKVNKLYSKTRRGSTHKT